MQKQYELILDKSPSAIVLMLNDTTLKYANPAFYSMFGFDESVLGKLKLVSLLHPEDLELQKPTIEKLKRKEVETFEIVQRMYKADNSIIWVHKSSNSICDENGEVTMELVIFTDITKQKEMEDTLKMVVSTVAHDLKNPLASIESFADLFLEHEHCDPSYIRYISNIKNASVHAQLIIHDLMENAILESAPVVYEKEVFNINLLLREMISICTVSSQKKQIAIIDNISEEECFIKANQMSIRRVFENLIANAIKFTKIGGEITITTEGFLDTVKVTIADNGVGIPDNLKPHIFDRFSKSYRHGTAGERSTGLGLYIVKKIIDIHSATISVDSEVDKGTSFDLVFEKHPLQDDCSGKIF